MVRFLFLIFSVTSAFCSLPPHVPARYVLPNPGHHNHWDNTPEEAPDRPSSRPPSPPVQQKQIAPNIVPLLVLPARAFRASDSSTLANSGAAGIVATITIRVPSYHSLSGNSSPVSPSPK